MYVFLIDSFPLGNTLIFATLVLLSQTKTAWVSYQPLT